MNLREIKEAVSCGRRVFCVNDRCEVRKFEDGYFIVYSSPYGTERVSSNLEDDASLAQDVADFYVK